MFYQLFSNITSHFSRALINWTPPSHHNITIVIIKSLQTQLNWPGRDTWAIIIEILETQFLHRSTDHNPMKKIFRWWAFVNWKNRGIGKLSNVTAYHHRHRHQLNSKLNPKLQKTKQTPNWKNDSKFPHTTAKTNKQNPSLFTQTQTFDYLKFEIISEHEQMINGEHQKCHLPPYLFFLPTGDSLHGGLELTHRSVSGFLLSSFCDCMRF